MLVLKEGAGETGEDRKVFLVGQDGLGKLPLLMFGEVCILSDGGQVLVQPELLKILIPGWQYRLFEFQLQ